MANYSAAGNLAPFFIDVVRGAINGGIGYINKFGANQDIDTTQEPVWDGSGVYAGWLQAADEVRVKAGGNAADAAAGNGARSVTIEGLDENWAEASETVDCNANGTLASALTTIKFIRVNRAYVATVGVYGSDNEGNVTIETEAGDVVAIILAGQGQTQMAMLTIPSGKVGLCVGVGASIDSTKLGTLYFYQRQNADDISAPMSSRRLWHSVTGLGGAHDHPFHIPWSFPERTDVWAEAVGPAGGAVFEVDLSMLLVPESA